MSSIEYLDFEPTDPSLKKELCRLGKNELDNDMSIGAPVGAVGTFLLIPGFIKEAEALRLIAPGKKPNQPPEHAITHARYIEIGSVLSSFIALTVAGVAVSKAIRNNKIRHAS